MPKLAHDIVIDFENKHISIDGEPLPWYVPLADIDVTIGKDGMSTIMLPIFFDGGFRAWGKPVEPVDYPQGSHPAEIASRIREAGMRRP